MHSPPNKRDVKNLSAKIRSAERLYEDLVMRENDEWAELVSVILDVMVLQCSEMRRECGMKPYKRR